MIARALLVAMPLVLTGSGCIPWRRTYTMWPEGKIKVIDAATNAPIVGAKVKLVREMYPHRREDARQSLVTDTKGEVSVTKETETKTVFPLMMHGVPGYGFVACAESKGYASRQLSWSVVEDGVTPTLELSLVIGSRPCGVTHDMTIPPGGKLRIEAVERETEDLWMLYVVTRETEPVVVGQTLVAPSGAKLSVLAVPHLGEPVAGIRRAQVRARGTAGTELEFGAIIDRAPAPTP